MQLCIKNVLSAAVNTVITKFTILFNVSFFIFFPFLLNCLYKLTQIPQIWLCLPLSRLGIVQTSLTLLSLLHRFPDSFHRFFKQPTAGNYSKLTMAGTATAYRSLMLFQKSHRLSKLSAVPLESSCIIFDDVAFPTISKNLSSYRLPI
jgi:hypothetical protein